LDVTYATTYYPDTTDPDDAAPIPLRGGEHMSADIHLSPVAPLHIVVTSPASPEERLRHTHTVEEIFRLDGERHGN
jgi:hypothetical protein